MSNCQVSKEIAEHCDEESNECPCCSAQLEEKSNTYGTWKECKFCDYETEQK